MYEKPKLTRYGTFREVTRQFHSGFVWCWVFPDIEPWKCEPHGQEPHEDRS